MPDIYLYPGEGVPSNIKLRDPTSLGATLPAIDVDSDITLAANDCHEWVLEETGAIWTEELTDQPVFEQADLRLAIFQVVSGGQVPWHLLTRMAA